MAIIAGVYVWVQSEELDTPVETAEHPVETGVDITSHVKPKPALLTLHGEMVGPGHEDTAAHFRALAKGGFAVSYIGRNVLAGALITHFSTRATHKIYGGVSFDMTLKELRIARKNWQTGVGYTDPLRIGVMNYDGTVCVEALGEARERYHQLMAGETLWFVANQYQSRGVTLDGLVALNAGRDIFRPGHGGEFEYLAEGARLLLGVW